MPEIKTFTKNIAGKEMSAEFGRLANQANGSVVLRYGDTVVLATATMSKEKKRGQDWFPLFVDYEERFYAGGKIKGSRFIKREGRPSDQAILSGRIIDRTIRPLFDERMRNEVQVIVTVLSIDNETNPGVLAVNAASLALAVSDIPWQGPVGAVQVGKINGDFLINMAPTGEDEERSLNLILAGTKEKINMIEADAHEISNTKMVEAVQTGWPVLQEVVAFQEEIIKEIGKEKATVELISPSADFVAEIKNFLTEHDLAGALYTKEKSKQKEKMETIKENLREMLADKFSEEELAEKEEEALYIYEQYLNEILHQKILNEGVRPDGRRPEEIRELTAEVGLLPRTHGSGLFQRGQTQALTTVTLGAPGDQQIIDTMELDEKKRYIHYYNFPPYSVGEVRPMRGPSRREIGHGALAEKALVPVLPSQEKFPYTMLLVSEILSSNGSSSMAATCGSSLALMDAGVPISRPVGGIAMGIIKGEDKYQILTDIQGPEDHWGDMDFKVAGTSEGITALQLDVKIEGIDIDLIAEVLERAEKAREVILGAMQKAIPAPRPQLSPYAPLIISMKIKPEKIGDVIGTGGKIINEIIDETGAAIDIEDDGTIFITAENQETGQKVKKWIEKLTKDIEVGDKLPGKVVRLMDFGAFVELLPGKDGLIHISNLSDKRVNKVSDILREGQKVIVEVVDVQDDGKIALRLVKAE